MAFMPRRCSNVVLFSFFLVAHHLHTTASETPMVFCHYMLYSFLYTDDVAGFTKEIQLAQAHGIDAFALNTQVWDSDYQTRADHLYDAADSLNFKLFISADMNSNPPTSLTLDNLTTMITRYRNRSSQLYYQGKQFFSTFAGRTAVYSPYSDSVSTWRDGVINATGGNVFFVPFFESSGDQGDISYLLNLYNSTLDGLFAWEKSAWPYLTDANTPSDAVDVNYIQVCGAAGKVYMASMSPWFFNNVSVKGNYAGDGLWRTHWEQLITLKPALVEIVTWNDWAERSYVVSIPQGSSPSGSSYDVGYTHLAYLDLANRYYIPWYKTGQAPAIDSASKEALYIFYYTQSKAGSQVNGSDALEDRLYVTVLLFEEANVTLSSGSQNASFLGLQAGLRNVSMMFEQGQQSASVFRNGVEILAIAGALPISNAVSTYDFNVYSNFVAASP